MLATAVIALSEEVPFQPEPDWQAFADGILALVSYVSLLAQATLAWRAMQ